MKAAISIVLAGLLVVLPLEQVQAQVAQQEAVSVEQDALPDGAAHLFRVPRLTENTARLWRTTSDQTFLNTPFPDALLVQEDQIIGWTGDGMASMVARDVSRVEVRPVPRLNTLGKVGVALLVIVGVAAILLAICLSDDDCVPQN